MRMSFFIIILWFLALLSVSSEARSNTRHRLLSKDTAGKLDRDHKTEVENQLFPTGSSLPDCSHACGPCMPCKRVMVSYMCAVESCPMVYRCMCKGKFYHVPSNKLH